MRNNVTEATINRWPPVARTPERNAYRPISSTNVNATRMRRAARTEPGRPLRFPAQAEQLVGGGDRHRRGSEQHHARQRHPQIRVVERHVVDADHDRDTRKQNEERGERGDPPGMPPAADSVEGLLSDTFERS